MPGVVFVRSVPLVALLLMVGRTLPMADAREIGPETNWCRAAHALAPGEALLLRPGRYATACTLRHGGTAEAPLVIGAKDPADPPRMVYAGTTSNVLNIRASHVRVHGLSFGPTAPNSDAIRIYGGVDIVIEACRFSRIGAIAIVANHGSVQNLTVRRNVILDSQSTAMYFGCHDGAGCRVTDLVVEENSIRSASARLTEVGYGIQVKLNSVAAIRDNVIADTKGPGIMVYGADDLRHASVVERNFVRGSLTSAGIVIGGGPAVVRNNVTVGNAEGGIALEDYQRRGLLRGLTVVHNTVYDNGKGGIVVPAMGVQAHIAGNAVHARPGTPPFRGEASDNADCSRRVCFAAPQTLDFSPLPGLGRRPDAEADPATPRDDFFRRPRAASPTIGAVEAAASPIRLDIKSID